MRNQLLIKAIERLSHRNTATSSAINAPKNQTTTQLSSQPHEIIRSHPTQHRQSRNPK